MNWRNRPGVNCCRWHHKKTKTNVTRCYLPMMSAACVTVQNGKAGNWMRLSGKRLPVVVVPGADHFFHRRLHILKDIIVRAWKD